MGRTLKREPRNAALQGKLDVVRGISSDGSVAAGYATGLTGSEGFRWKQETGMVAIGGGSGSAVALSGNGLVVAGGGPNQTFRCTQADGFLGADSPGLFPIGYGLNFDGSVVVGALYNNSQSQAFRWMEGSGIVGLGQGPGFRSTIAVGVSNDGSLVIGDGGSAGGFIWTPDSGLHHLLDVLNTDYGIADQLAGWSALNPLAISPDGRFIVGSGIDQGIGEGWILDRGLAAPPIGPPPDLPPFPEPSDYGIVASLLLLGVA